MTTTTTTPPRQQRHAALSTHPPSQPSPFLTWWQKTFIPPPHSPQRYAPRAPSTLTHLPRNRLRASSKIDLRTFGTHRLFLQGILLLPERTWHAVCVLRSDKRMLAKRELKKISSWGTQKSCGGAGGGVHGDCLAVLGWRGRWTVFAGALSLSQLNTSSPSRGKKNRCSLRRSKRRGMGGLAHLSGLSVGRRRVQQDIYVVLRLIEHIGVEKFDASVGSELVWVGGGASKTKPPSFSLHDDCCCLPNTTRRRCRRCSPATRPRPPPPPPRAAPSSPRASAR